MRRGRIAKTPSYLAYRHGVYYFRYHVQPEHQQALGKELFLSLRTGHIQQARQRAQMALRVIQTNLSDLECIRMVNLCKSDIKKRIREHLDQMLELGLLSVVQTPEALASLGLGEVHASSQKLQQAIDSLKRSLAERRYASLDMDVRSVASDLNISVEPGTVTYDELAHELGRGLILCLNIALAVSKADFDSEYRLRQLYDGMFDTVAHDKSGAPELHNAQENQGPLLTKIIDDYLASNKESLSPRTLTAYTEALAIFVDIVGDMDIAHVSHTTLRDFISTMRKLPAHRTKKPQYRGKSIKRLLKMNIPDDELITPRTVNNLLGHVGAFLTWAQNQGYPVENYAKGKNIKEPGKRMKEPGRLPFSPDDLAKIFNSDVYRSDAYGKAPWKFWFPVLGLFTGARAGELAQLLVDDVKQIDGVWCIDINDMGDKRTKTASSRRIVPLHPFLIDTLMFQLYVARLKESGQTKVFPELKSQRGSSAAYLSRWFGPFIKGLGIEAEGDKGKSFHSFRHLFAHTCKVNDVPEMKAAEVTGHSKGASETLAYGWYGGKLPAKKLYNDVIKALKFDVDLKHLAKCRIVRNLNDAN